MNQVYVTFDLDNAGQLVGSAILNDDLESLEQARDAINGANTSVKEWVKFHQGEIINIGGDEGVFSIPEEAIDHLEDLKARIERAAGTTVTIGFGSRPSEASKALFAGKLNHKDQIVGYSEEVEHFLHEAHQHSIQGDASEDELKVDEHYLSHSPEYQNDDENQSTENFDEENPEDFEQADGMGQETEEGLTDNSEDASDEMEDDSEDEPRYIVHGDDYEDSESDLEEPSQDDNSEEWLDDQLAEDPTEQGTDVEDIVAAPEDQNIAEEEPLDIDPELEKDGDEVMDDGTVAQDDDSLPAPEEMSGDSDQEDQNAEGQAPSQEEMSEQGSPNQDIMQSVAEVLSVFKNKKDQIEQIKQADPEMYEAITGMLQAMVGMAQALNGGGQEAPKQ